MYDQLSHDYDRFVNWPNRLAYEMPFLLQKLKGIKKQPSDPLRVLDAACGTGQHAIALAKAGMHVSGADLSTEMIAVAHANAADAGVNVDFQAAGFGSLTYSFGKASFDALLCLGNSLPHLLSSKDLEKAVIDFYTCLAPGGLLVIQNRNFDAVLPVRNRWMEPQSHREGDREWIFQRFYDFEPDGLIRFNIVTLQRRGQEDWQASLTSTRLYPQTRREVDSAVLNAGFAHLHVYGSLEEVEFDLQKSSNLVILATKP
jgi:glycine/sarcosine N-methyltransferase